MDNTQTEIRDMPPGAHKLPSGGWVLLSDESETTGADVMKIRRSLDAHKDGVGSVSNMGLIAALDIRVRDWEIPGRPNLPLPRGNTTWAVLIGWEDMLALEELVEDWAQRILSGSKKTAKDGSDPQPPASE